MAAGGAGGPTLSGLDETRAARSRTRLNIGLWIGVLLAGVLVIAVGAVMWNLHADDDGSVLARVARTVVDKHDSDAADEGKAVGSGVVKAVPAAPIADQERISDVLVAATKFVNTFMNVDYKTMDSTFASISATSTGAFQKQFDKSVESLKSLTTRVKSVQTSEVVWAGYSSGDADSATVLIATQGTMSSTASKGKALARYDRVRVDLAKVDGTWLTNNLTFLAA